MIANRLHAALLLVTAPHVKRSLVIITVVDKRESGSQGWVYRPEVKPECRTSAGNLGGAFRPRYFK